MNTVPFEMDFKSSLVEVLREVPRVQVSAGVRKNFFETDIEILLETPEGKRQIVVDVKSTGAYEIDPVLKANGARVDYYKIHCYSD